MKEQLCLSKFSRISELFEVFNFIIKNRNKKWQKKFLGNFSREKGRTNFFWVIFGEKTTKIFFLVDFPKEKQHSDRLIDWKFLLLLTRVGFKARMTFEDCLKERDRLTLLASVENRYFNFTGVTAPGQGPVMLHHNYSHYTKLSLPECDLQKELDNVRLHFSSKKKKSETLTKT